MISTVTTATVSTVTAVALASSLALLAVVALLALLIHKEILSGSDSPRAKSLSKALNIAIIPLLLSFVFIAVVRVMAVLN